LSETLPITKDEVNQIIGYLNDHKLRQQQQLYFVQIGSNDGLQGDPLNHHISNHSDTWQGVLVEPVKFLFERLKKTYEHQNGLAFENSLISDKRERVSFYYVDSKAETVFSDLPYWYDQLGSFDSKHIVKHLGNRILPYIREEHFNSITLQDLFLKYSINKLDLLHIDTEGHDYRILKQLKLSQACPTLILIEYKHLTFWETFKLVNKLKEKYKLFVVNDDLLAIELTFAEQITKGINLSHLFLR